MSLREEDQNKLDALLALYGLERDESATDMLFKIVIKLNDAITSGMFEKAKDRNCDKAIITKKYYQFKRYDVGYISQYVKSRSGRDEAIFVNKKGIVASVPVECFKVINTDVDFPSSGNIFLSTIDALDLKTKTKNILAANGIKYIGDLAQLGELGLLRLADFGSKSLYDVTKSMKENNIEFVPIIENWPEMVAEHELKG